MSARGAIVRLSWSVSSETSPSTTSAGSHCDSHDSSKTARGASVEYVQGIPETSQVWAKDAVPLVFSSSRTTSVTSTVCGASATAATIAA